MAKNEKSERSKNEIVDAVAAHLVVDQVKNQISKPVELAVASAVGAGSTAGLVGVTAVGLGLTAAAPVIAVVAVVGGIIGLVAAAASE